MATGASISSATTGAPASPGPSPSSTPSGCVPSPSCRARIRCRSRGRWRCPTASRSAARAITRRSSSPMPCRSCSRTTARGCARGTPRKACRRRRSTSICPCSGSAPAMEAALAWYRARGERMPLGPIKVPTLYVWGDADDTVGRAAAEGTGEFIDAPYRFEVLPGVGHYAADQSAGAGQRTVAGASRPLRGLAERHSAKLAVELGQPRREGGQAPSTRRPARRAARPCRPASSRPAAPAG